MQPGTIGWIDLTVENAEEVRDFYEAVVGWKSNPVSQGDYDDYSVGPHDADTVAGVCHHRGANEGIPAQWLIYIVVEDLDASLRECESRGGALVYGPRAIGESQVAVIQDPGGAVCALYQA